MQQKEGVFLNEHGNARTSDETESKQENPCEEPVSVIGILFTKLLLFTLCKHNEECEQERPMEQIHKLKRHFTHAKVKSTAFAHRRGVPRRRRMPRRMPMRRENRAKNGDFRGFVGVFGGPGEAEKAPRGGFSPANQGLRAAGRSRGLSQA